MHVSMRFRRRFNGRIRGSSSGRGAGLGRRVLDEGVAEVVGASGPGFDDACGVGALGGVPAGIDDGGAGRQGGVEAAHRVIPDPWRSPPTMARHHNGGLNAYPRALE